MKFLAQSQLEPQILVPLKRILVALIKICLACITNIKFVSSAMMDLVNQMLLTRTTCISMLETYLIMQDMIQLIKFLFLRICGVVIQKFIDDAADQSIQIKGFDLDFDTLTWTLLGVSNTDGAWGEMEGGETGGAIADAPLQLSSTGVVTPKSTLSFEDGKTWFHVYVQITDGKSTAVKKQFYFQVEDTLGDGSLTVSGTAMVGSYSLANATIWQDLDNDGLKDAGEPNTTSDIDGRFNISVTKSDTDAPILATSGFNTGTGVANTGIYKINSNLKINFR